MCSLNVRGLHNETKRKEVFKFMRKNKANIICLQETHSEPGDQRLWSKQWVDSIHFTHGSNQAKGVCIMFNKVGDLSITKVKNDVEGRYLILECSYHDYDFLLCGVYVPNRDDPNFFSQLLKDIAQFNNKEIILMGDFNVVLDPSLDRSNSKVYSPHARDALLRFIDEFELFNVWRGINPECKIFSWYKKQNRKQGSRIDFLFTTQGVFNRLTQIEYSWGYKTDHSLIHTELCSKIGKMVQGTGNLITYCYIIRNM